MTSICEVEHCPECRIWVRFGDLKQWLLVAWRVWIRQRQLVDRRMDARVCDGPLEISRRFAPHRLVSIGVRRMTRVRHVSRSTRTARPGGWDHLGNAEVALRGSEGEDTTSASCASQVSNSHARSQKKTFSVVRGMDERVENLRWIAVRSDDERGQMVGNGRMVG